MTSAAEFVEGGVQDPCDDACSICLESFCEDDPATITSCKHEYHLQCILEWSQRSKECPMCWQPLSLKDPDSQELLLAVEQERALRRNKVQASHIYHRSPVEEYEFDRFAHYGDEDCIMQHLAAAAMGRHQMGRREQIRFRSSATAQGHPHHPHFVLVSGTPAGAPSSPISSSPVASPPQPTNNESLATVFTFPHYSTTNRDGSSLDSATLRHRAELEEHGTSSDSLDTFKSRLAAASSRYKETLTKSTKGFRERMRTRGGIMQDLGARAREVSAVVGRALERMSLEPATDRQDSSHSPPANPLDTHHHPPDHPPGHLGSGAGSSRSPSSEPATSGPSPSLTPTPELRSGEH